MKRVAAKNDPKTCLSALVFHIHQNLGAPNKHELSIIKHASIE